MRQTDKRNVQQAYREQLEQKKNKKKHLLEVTFVAAVIVITIFLNSIFKAF
ncbi:hypothetical protein [Bacillus sp. REN10]|uniref:hypothetical protein n=1 Tax=Bacillus sp. REN10 TaxID=2782541 RepID=UPI00193B4DDE|nr:hypothetical protein [Bacillus sp. REN10]